VVRAANRDLAEFQQIRRWILWPDPDLPRTTTGKVLHRKIAAAIQASAQGSPPASKSGLAEILYRITGEDSDKLPDSARLSENLHLDSLGRVELQSAIELQFGIDTAEPAFQRVQTLGELKDLLKAPLKGGPAPEGQAADAFSYPEWPWSPLARGVRSAFMEAIMRPLTLLLAAARVKRSLATDPVRPVLIVSNHVTEYDAPLILSALSRRMRSCVAIAMAGEMLHDFRRSRNPFERLKYWLAIALFNVFPLPQRGNFRQSFAHAGRAMDRGFHVMVFPEGRRTPDGKMHEFQGGAGILWTQLACQATRALVPLRTDFSTDRKPNRVAAGRRSQGGGRHLRAARARARFWLILPAGCNPGKCGTLRC